MPCSFHQWFFVVHVGHDYGLTTVDVTNPSAPAVVYNFSTFVGGANDFIEHGDLLFTATYEGGFHIYNISNPIRPVEIGYNETLYYVSDTNYSRGLIYVTNTRAGFWIFEHDLDNDSLYSYLEYQIGTNPFDWDTDDDGWSDYDEWLEGTDPLDPDDYPHKSNKNLIIGLSIIGASLVIGTSTITATLLIRRRKRIIQRKKVPRR